jgi:5,10-methenyltetrahydromethanopterin hydrogenase
MTLPQEIKIKINEEANEFAERVPKCEPHIAYFAGATEWAGKAQSAIVTLEQIDSVVSWMDDGTFKSKLLDILAKYREVGNA